MTNENWYRQLGEYLIANGERVRGVIGATMHLICLFGKNLVIDCGIGFDKSDDVQTQYVPDGNWLIGMHIHLIILTHKHLDHVGALVRFIWHHPEALIFMSAKTFEGACIAIEDSLKIWRNEAKAAQRNSLPIPEQVFTAEMVEAFYNNPNVRVFDAPYWLDQKDDLRDEWPGWEIGFYDAGHDVGAVSTYMILPNGKYFYLTGDIASHDQENVPGVLLPPDSFLGNFFDRPGTMVTEATNGNRRMEVSREQLDREFEQLVRSVDARGGVLLCSEFAGTKSGNQVIRLNRLGYKVVVDGLAREHIRVEISDIDERIRDGRVFLIEENRDKKDLAWQQREEYATGVHGFVPVIAASATFDQGYAASAYGPMILDGDKNAVIFTSHIFDNSTAERLFNIRRGHTIKLKKWDKDKRALEPVYVNVRCNVIHFPYSSHDYQDGLVERVRLVQPETLLVHHCPGKGSFDAFAERVRALPNPPKIIRWALNGETIYI